MAVQDKKVVLFALAVCAALGAAYVLGTRRGTERSTGELDEKSKRELETKKVAKMTWERWSELVDSSIRERRDILSGLVEVAEDKARGGEERIFAIHLIGRAGSQGSIDFLMDNISLWIEKDYHDSDDSAQKQWACFYTLKSMGWQVVPYAIDFTNAERGQKQLELLARLLEHICGRKVARAILEEKVREFADDPGKLQGVKNMRRMLSHIAAAERGRE